MRLTRRRFLIVASAAGLAGGLLAARGARALVWRGAALGGEASITLFGADRDASEAALADAAAEIERLEVVFSLYRPDSQLSRLNRDGALAAPARDLLEMARAALSWRRRTEGAFDPTVQPLWRALAEGRDPAPARLLAGAAVTVEAARIALPSGAALTLNGIAQGTIADRVAAVLARHGFQEVAVDAGELRLPGRAPRAVRLPAADLEIETSEIAIATSEPGALRFDRAGRRGHLLDPRTGESADHWRSVTVLAPSAETADALSTAFAVSSPEQVGDLAASVSDVAVIAVDRDGRLRRYGDARLAGLA